jgi:DNA-binding SARP family transcriptional activator/DNA-binding beta-propeller fold protein YncE
VLALLALGAGESVSSERLIDELWGEEPPRTARKTLQVHVSRLRGELGDDVIETVPRGYVLRLARSEVDLLRFEDLVRRGRSELEADDPKSASSTLREALSIWRGPALAGLEGEPFAQAAAARLEDLRVAATELRIEADLTLGRHAELVDELERLVREHPFREGPRRQLMLALYRSGRQADALARYREARAVLMDELGVEPGPVLRELEVAMLRQDPALDPEPPLRPRVRRRRRAAASLVLVVLVASAVAAALVLALHSDAKTARPDRALAPVSDSVVRIDPHTNRIVQVTKVGREPSEVAVGRDAVWVVNFRDRTVSKVTSSGAVETIGGVRRADHLAVDGDAVWVSGFDQGSVSRINARSGEVAASIGLPANRAEGLALGGGYLWITSPSDVRGSGLETIDRLDLRSGRIESRIAVGRTPIFAAFGYGSAWTANYDDGTVSVVRPGSSKAETVPVCAGPLGIATGFGAVWVVCYWTKELVRIDSRTRRVVATIPTGASPLDVSAGAGAVWVTNRLSGTVQRVNPRTNKVTATIRFPGALSPQGISARNGAVWVTVQRCSTPDCV